MYNIIDLVFTSADAMMRKLYKKELEGYSGWADDNPEVEKNIKTKLKANIVSRDWVDVMALAAMLNYRALKNNQQINSDRADIQSITEILDMWYSSDAQDHDYQEKNMECPTCALIRLRHVLKNKT